MVDEGVGTCFVEAVVNVIIICVSGFSGCVIKICKVEMESG